MVVALFALCASGYVLPSHVLPSRCAARAVADNDAVDSSTKLFSNELVDDVRECIVDAENAAEIAACHDTTLGTTYEDCIVNAESAAEIADCGAAPAAPLLTLDEECVVEAESAEELLACGDTTLGTTYEDCIVSAENAAEIADCGAYKTAQAPPLAASASASVDGVECVVSAENAAEIADCE